MSTGSSFRYLVRRRTEVLCDTAGITWEAARDWTIVREVVNAMWAARVGGPGARERVSLAMTLVKALGD